MKEQWKDLGTVIKEIGEHRYEISNFGNLKLYGHKKNLPLGKISSGYYNYRIWIYDELGNAVQRKNYPIHRLVALAFVENDDIKRDVVNHIDGNRLNNSYTNLEWCTANENQEHSRMIEKAIADSKINYFDFVKPLTVQKIINEKPYRR